MFTFTLKDLLTYSQISINDLLSYVHVCLVTQSCPALCDSLDCSSSAHGIFQARILERVAFFSLQGTLPTQELNLSLLCLLHCRRILYQLSHQGRFFLATALNKISTQGNSGMEAYSQLNLYASHTSPPPTQALHSPSPQPFFTHA